jgi:hypothetical protein
MSEPTGPDSEQRRYEFAPVIEQAKAIIMAQFRCGPDEAFEILCGMSQHANVKLRILAERMVERATPPRHRITILLTRGSRYSGRQQYATVTRDRHPAR